MSENLIESVLSRTEEDRMVARAHALVMPRTRMPGAEAIDLIRQLGTGMIDGRPVQESDVFVFDMVAASDGVDSYWTQQDLKTSLKPMAEDLIAGQSVLGNHDYGTFSYGSSIAATVDKAKTDAPYYEQTFYRGITDERMVTSHLLVGTYFITRGLRLNGEETDSIIRGLETGAIRKASISFMVGEYVCGLDGLPMTAMSWLAWDKPGGGRKARDARHDVEDAPARCEHFPGIEYPEGIAWAVMKGNQLLETSMVYKNSSPSALLIARAAEMARAGLLTSAQAGILEERFALRLPRFERSQWAGGQPKEDTMLDDERTPDEPEIPADDPEEEPTEEPTEEPEQEPEEEPEDREPEAPEALSAAVDATVEQIEAGALTADQLESVYRAESRLDEALAGRDQNSVSRVVTRLAEARLSAVTEALGREPDAESIRALVQRAEIGDELYSALVNDAVAARVGIGVQFNEEEYRKVLVESRSIDFVRSERSSWLELKQQRFKAGRTTPTRDVPALDPRSGKGHKSAPESSKAEEAADDNILAPRAKK